MREIKFRAYWTHPESESTGFDYFDPIEGFKRGDMCQEVVAVEQFTGLHDKNGREIYEGDIVNIVQLPCWYKGYEKTVVRWDEIGFYPWTDVSSEIDRDYLASRLPEDIEIVGNIHENPELLNG